MNEKEKMLNGQQYNPNDTQLIQARIECKRKCQEYNQLSYENLEEHKNKLKNILGSFQNNFVIEPNFWCDYGYNISLGENFYSNHNLVILDPAPVKFGNNVFIGPNCSFYTAHHPLDATTRNQEVEYAYPIEVGNDVWFGGNVTVLPGVKIGNNVVIGAGSVVTKNIPDNVVAAGNPCKIIKQQ